MVNDSKNSKTIVYLAPTNYDAYKGTQTSDGHIYINSSVDNNKKGYSLYIDNLPTPALATTNDKSKTIYIKNSGWIQEVDLKNISFKDLKEKAIKLEKYKNGEQIDEERQGQVFVFSGASSVDKNRQEVFSGKLDKLVENAHFGLHLQNGEHENVTMQDDNSIKVRNLGFDNGESMTVTKLEEDASKFKITLYNEKDEVTLDGQFYCHSDRNGNLIKYNSEGEIVDPNDLNYGNSENIPKYEWSGTINGLRKFMGQGAVEQGERNIENIKQYETIKKFENCRGTVFDEPVKLATEVYQELVETTGKNKIIRDLSDDGDRIEFNKIENPKDLDPNKNGYTIELTSYDEENRMSMQGTFTLLRDNNGNPLKENKEGKIFKPDDPGYDNKDNKLCFDIKLKTYYSDIQKLDCQFERTINLDDKKQRHTMFAQQFDRNGNILPDSATFNFTCRLYTEDWAKGRLLKMAFETSKKDLKEIKDDFEHDMINPEDLIKMTKEETASFLASNKKDVLDFPTELATTAYEYMKKHPDCFQNGREYERIDLANDEFIDVRKYNDNQSDYKITLYNRNSKPTLYGLFRFSDENHLLKENKEGKIFKPGDLEYDNQYNKLCFPMSYFLYNSGTGKKTFEFTRNIANAGEKKVHSISMKKFDNSYRDGVITSYTGKDPIMLEQILPNPKV